jgi:pimeloyl-ACP methyl ester carboxylesterase
VLVHGLALDTRMWDDQVPALADIATVVRYDVRGFGRSTRDASTPYSNAGNLRHLLDHVGIDHAVLVGLSMGGRVVVEATLAAPERVRALVLLDAVLDGVPWDADSARGMNAIGEELRACGLDAAKAAWLRHGFFAPAQRDPDVARRLKNVRLHETIRLPASASGVVRWQSPKTLGPGTYFVQVKAVDTGGGGVTDCPPKQVKCNVRWSSLHRVLIRR